MSRKFSVFFCDPLLIRIFFFFFVTFCACCNVFVCEICLFVAHFLIIYLGDSEYCLVYI